MIQTDIINALAVGVVGWEQPTKSGSPTVSTANKASSSGLFYQKGHALCTIDNIKSAVDDESITDDNLNTELSKISSSALTDVCHGVFSENDHIDTGLLFKYENRFSETIDNATDFVGYEIDLQKRNDLALIVNSLILEFDSAATIKILLFNSTQNGSVKILNATALANSAKATSAGWTLTDLEYGGKWYIGYLRSALTAKAIKRNFQQSSLATCFQSVGIRPIRVTGWDAETMFDPSSIRYEADTWGLNFNISMYKDFTQIIKYNVNRFAKAQQLMGCVKALEMIGNSVRSNKSERLSKAYVMLELDGNRNNPDLPLHTGLYKMVEKEIKALRETYYPRGIQKVTL